MCSNNDNDNSNNGNSNKNIVMVTIMMLIGEYSLCIYTHVWRLFTVQKVLDIGT